MSNLNILFEEINKQLFQFELYHTKNSNELEKCLLKGIFKKTFVEIIKRPNYNETNFLKLNEYARTIENLEKLSKRWKLKRDKDYKFLESETPDRYVGDLYLGWKGGINEVSLLLIKFLAKNETMLPKESTKKISDLLNSKKENDTFSQQTNNNIVIKWNEQSNVLTDIIKQLKTIYNKDSEPLIANSYEEVAVFLKNNFSCFAETKLSTITTQLKNNNNRPKSNRVIDIKQSKE